MIRKADTGDTKRIMNDPLVRGAQITDAATAGYEAKRDGLAAGSVTLVPGKRASGFEGTLEVTAPGMYEITLYAFDPANGNAGVDSIGFVVR